MLTGTPVSPGIAIAPAHRVERERKTLCKNINSFDIDHELFIYTQAQRCAKQKLESIYNDALKKLTEEEAAIFAVHLGLLEEDEFINRVPETIKAECVSAEYAVTSVTETIAALFNNIEDDLIRARKNDVLEISDLLIETIKETRSGNTESHSSDHPCILVVEELMAGDILNKDSAMIKGILSAQGNETAHATIIAKSLGIPFIMQAKETVHAIAEGDMLLLDANEGRLFVHAAPESILAYKKNIERMESRQNDLRKILGRESITLDGVKVDLFNNAGSLDEIRKAKEAGGEGIGLFRTEFLFMGSSHAIGEDEQFEIYRDAVKALNGRCLTIRTMDLGGDKEIPHLQIKEESNSFLGQRGIRFCLKNLPLFETQLRAIARASAYGKIRMMFPMISTIEELRKTKDILNSVCKSFDATQVNIETGIMVETPAAAIMVDALIREADFLSIGTNDLCQYTFAVDRTNPLVDYLYNPVSPAMLRLIKNIVECGAKAGKHVGMCGEMASNTKYTALLLGMGLREFSVGIHSLAPVKEIIINANTTALEKLAGQALQCTDNAQIEALLSDFSECR